MNCGCFRLLCCLEEWELSPLKTRALDPPSVWSFLASAPPPAPAPLLPPLAPFAASFESNFLDTTPFFSPPNMIADLNVILDSVMVAANVTFASVTPSCDVTLFSWISVLNATEGRFILMTCQSPASELVDMGSDCAAPRGSDRPNLVFFAGLFEVAALGSSRHQVAPGACWYIHGSSTNYIDAATLIIRQSFKLDTALKTLLNYSARAPYLRLDCRPQVSPPLRIHPHSLQCRLEPTAQACSFSAPTTMDHHYHPVAHTH